MKDISEVTFCVVDKGLFPHIAQAIAKDAKKVFYAGPPEQVMRRLQDDLIGDGFPNIERVDSYLEVEDLCDVFAFTDIGFTWEQKKLVKEGKAVWGHKGGDIIEVDKGVYIRTLEELEMAVPPHVVKVGMDALIDELWDKEDKFVKVSKWRDDWETFNWRNRELDIAYLYGHKFNRSPVRNLITFYIFDKIEGTIEDGIDTWCIDGKWPKNVLHAMECKDKSLLGTMQPLSDIHESVREVNEIIGPYLGAKFGYRGAFSTEVRPPYLIDPTCRFGSPPSQLQSVLITNWAEIIYHGANGELIEPQWDDPVGAQVLITTDKERDDYLTFQMPDELRRDVASSFSFEVDKNLCVAPNPLENFAGWLMATGPDMQAVIDSIKEKCELLPPGFDCDITSLAHLLKELEDAKEEGITMADKSPPEPAEVLS